MSAFVKRIRREFPIFRSTSRPSSDGRLIVNAGYILGVNLLGAASGVIFWGFATRLYPLESVGKTTALVSVVQAISALSLMGLGSGLIRFLSRLENPTHMLNSTLTIVGMATSGTLLIYLLGLSCWSPRLLEVRTEPGLLVVIVLFTLAASLSALLQNIFTASRTSHWAFWQMLLMHSLRLLLILAFVSLGLLGLLGALSVSMTASILVGMFVFVPKVIPGFRPALSISSTVFHQLMPFAIGMQVVNFLFRTPALLTPPLVLEFLGGAESA